VSALSDLDLAGRVAVVTGGARGIGLACVRILAAAGAATCIWDRDSAEAKERAAELAANGLDVSWQGCDISDEEQVEEAMRALLARHGGLDIAVCNAGIGWVKPVTETTVDEWRKLAEINLTGAFITARRAVIAMREGSKKGSVVLVSSPHAHRTIPESGPYAATKAGVLGLMRALAVEAAAWGIRVNAVLPGPTDTPMLRAEAEYSDESIAATFERWGRARPLGRVGQPEEIANAVLFAACSLSSYMTGTEITVDGGMTSAMPKDMNSLPRED
jgi:NAD(P)-dependent dehydrogenase (short-subunit alcohol dehydrogenase family)